MPRRCACFRKDLKIAQRAVGGMHVGVVGYIVAVVAPGRGIEGKQPDERYAQVLQVIELLGEAAKIAHAVGVAVGESADMDFIDDRVLVPLRIGI